MPNLTDTIFELCHICVAVASNCSNSSTVLNKLVKHRRLINVFPDFGPFWSTQLPERGGSFVLDFVQSEI